MIRCMQSKLVLNIKNNLEDSLVLHYNNYDRQYENGGYLDTYYSESFITKGERSIKYSNKLSLVLGQNINMIEAISQIMVRGLPLQRFY